MLKSLPATRGATAVPLHHSDLQVPQRRCTQNLSYKGFSLILFFSNKTSPLHTFSHFRSQRGRGSKVYVSKTTLNPPLPISEETIYFICSGEKMFTQVSIESLLQKGKHIFHSQWLSPCLTAAVYQGYGSQEFLPLSCLYTINNTSSFTVSAFLC